LNAAHDAPDGRSLPGLLLEFKVIEAVSDEMRENIESEWPREVAPEVSLIIRCVDRFSVVFYENFPCCPA
jgi:hypothetical protein